MAISRVIERIAKVLSAVIPERKVRSLNKNLEVANISLDPYEWISIFILLLPVALSIVYILFKIKLLEWWVILITPFAVLLMIPLIPKYRAGKRKEEIEKALPDAFHQMAVSLRTGMGPEKALEEIATAKYGSLSFEFRKTVTEIKRGRPFKDALLAMARRIDSEELNRTVRLITEGMDAGAGLSDILDAVVEDLIEIRRVKRDRVSTTAQQISFVAMASVCAGPFTMGLITGLPPIFKEMVGGAKEIPPEVYTLTKIAMVYILIQAVIGGLMTGAIMYGDMKKGAKYIIFYAIGALLIFKISPIVIQSMV